MLLHTVYIAKWAEFSRKGKCSQEDILYPNPTSTFSPNTF